MAAPADFLDASDLKNVLAGGLIREDVLDQIFDISDIPTPFQDSINDGASFDNPYSEWTEDRLNAPNLANAVVSGSNATRVNRTNNGRRVGNHAQISTGEVAVTQRVENTDNIGRSDELAYQTGRGLQELRRDVEAISLSRQASRADDGNATAGKTAGFPSWLVTNTQFGATGAAGG